MLKEKLACVDDGPEEVLDGGLAVGVVVQVTQGDVELLWSRRPHECREVDRVDQLVRIVNACVFPGPVHRALPHELTVEQLQRLIDRRFFDPFARTGAFAHRLTDLKLFSPCRGIQSPLSYVFTNTSSRGS